MKTQDRSVFSAIGDTATSLRVDYVTAEEIGIHFTRNAWTRHVKGRKADGSYIDDRATIRVPYRLLPHNSLSHLMAASQVLRENYNIGTIVTYKQADCGNTELSVCDPEGVRKLVSAKLPMEIFQISKTEQPQERSDGWWQRFLGKTTVFVAKR